MMCSAFRCATCLVNWPPTAEFEACPECGGKTDPMSTAQAIPVDEAISRLRHAEFEKFYADWSAKQLDAELEHADLEHIQRGNN